MVADIFDIVRQLGLIPEQVTQYETLSERHGHQIWRTHTSNGTYVLKWFADEMSALAELGGYSLLAELGVPTLPVYGITRQSLLIEDLKYSLSWRVAEEKDMSNPKVGEAIAGWYKVFHEYGIRFLARANQIPSFLLRESDCLDKDCIFKTADRLGLSENSVWQLAIDNIDLLKTAEKRLSVTLNYNDYHWSNLALSRSDDRKYQAVIFDYHLLGIGMPYSDCRNIIGSLSENTISAFWNTYGKVDLREEIIDKPLSTLVVLVTAAQRSRFPKWAEECRLSLIKGDLDRDIRKAIDLARTI